MIQQTQEWFESRRGRATASMFSAILAKGEGKTRKAYMLKLAAERLTGQVAESFSNSHTQRGTEQEPLARLAYEARTGELVETVGFIAHSEIMAGASPDGLVNHDGGVEIKSVIPTVQIETIQRGGYPIEHRAQIQGGLWITGRQWWDFCSYSPAMPEHLRLYVFGVERDQAYIDELDKAVRAFLGELDAMVEKLMAV